MHCPELSGLSDAWKKDPLSQRKVLSLVIHAEELRFYLARRNAGRYVKCIKNIVLCHNQATQHPLTHMRSNNNTAQPNHTTATCVQPHYVCGWGCAAPTLTPDSTQPVGG